MKKILLFTMVCFSLSLFSQEFKNDTITVEQYCDIVGTSKFLSNKVTIQVDFGESLPYFKDNRLRDEITGKVITFNSMIDAVNDMAINGWTLHSTMLIGSGNSFVYHYIMKKNVKVLRQKK